MKLYFIVGSVCRIDDGSDDGQVRISQNLQFLLLGLLGGGLGGRLLGGLGGILLGLLGGGLLLSLLVVSDLLGGLLDILGGLDLLGSSGGNSDIVGDEEVVEDGARLYLPHVNSDVGEGVVGVQGVVIDVFWLGGLRVGKLGRDVVMALWLGVLWVIHLGLIDPVLWLLVLWVIDLLLLKELPALGEGTSLDRYAIDGHIEGVVWLDSQGVKVGELVALGTEVLSLQQVLLVVVEDEVGALGHTADVRSKHDVVLGVSVEFLAVEWGRSKLEVSTTAVDVLLVLDGVLNDESLVLVAESREGGRDSVELGILGCP